MKAFLLRLARVEPIDEGWLAEKKIEVLDLVEAVLERVVSVDREVGGDDREPRSSLNFSLQEVSQPFPACDCRGVPSL